MYVKSLSPHPLPRIIISPSPPPICILVFTPELKKGGGALDKKVTQLFQFNIYNIILLRCTRWKNEELQTIVTDIQHMDKTMCRWDYLGNQCISFGTSTKIY